MLISPVMNLEQLDKVQFIDPETKDLWGDPVFSKETKDYILLAKHGYRQRMTDDNLIWGQNNEQNNIWSDSQSDESQ
ncbi:MAG: hypothetical protein HOD89_08465 [Thiotrichales bacterium]|nr:hypothetical protein [Thiotrichales bacterium]MBT4573376.1 hypothetical protein [Thiotrichales bacterium]MBT7314903.1 hypothetical protein [Thiotrichales bacterium]MBT7870042.1 hypothetical protein [Thiotrichales bacterium]